MRVVSLLNSGAHINTTKVYSVTSRTDMAYVFVSVTSIYIRGVQVQCMHVGTRGNIHFALCTFVHMYM